MDISGGKLANFHLVTAGSCWASVPEAGFEGALSEGDLAVFPHGCAHTIADRKGGYSVPAGDFLSSGRTSPDGQLLYGGAGDTTILVCGHFERDRAASHPLWESLPEMIVLRKADGVADDWFDTAVRLAVHESRSADPGANSVVDRMAEVLLIQILRAYSRQAESEVGFITALSDAVLGRVLSLMHETPERHWTLSELARTVGVSRTTLALRFKERVGVSPIRYLTDWRLARARELLVNTDSSLARIAEATGYHSDFSLARAYKRKFGITPGSERRDSRTA